MPDAWQPLAGDDEPRTKPLNAPARYEGDDKFWAAYQAAGPDDLKPASGSARFNALHPRDSKGRFMRKLNVGTLLDVFVSPGMEADVTKLFDNLRKAGINVENIDRRHQLPKFESRPLKANGQFVWKENTVVLNENFVGTPFAEMTLAHEFGHFIDIKLLNNTDDPGASAMETHQPISADDEAAWLYSQIDKSYAVKLMRDKRQDYERKAQEAADAQTRVNIMSPGEREPGRAVHYYPDSGKMEVELDTGEERQVRPTRLVTPRGYPLIDPKADFLSYLLRPRELFARAFMQYVTTRANPDLFESNYRPTILEKMPFRRQWMPEDFQGIDLGFTTTLQANGWLTSSN